MLSDEDKTLGMLAHLLSIFAGFIGPLVLYLIFKDKKKKEFVKNNAKNALNFQISLIIYGLICIILMFALMFILIGFLFIFVIWALSIFALVVEIIGCIRSYKGEVYEYPLAIPFIKN
jgi:uncharacterized Tic20 family protein